MTTVEADTTQRPCVECKGGGRIHEVLRYTSPPPGDEIFASSKSAWPPIDPKRTVRVDSERACIACGGRGEL